MSELTYPADLKYTSDHEWIKDLGDGVYRVGITAYAQDALGDVVYVNVPAVGDTVAQGDSCGEVESTKSVSDVLSPLAGEIVKVNEALESAPETVNTDPYGEGWMFDVKVDGEVPGDLMDADAYQATLD